MVFTSPLPFFLIVKTRGDTSQRVDQWEESNRGQGHGSTNLIGQHISFYFLWVMRVVIFYNSPSVHPSSDEWPSSGLASDPQFGDLKDDSELGLCLGGPSGKMSLQ